MTLPRMPICAHAHRPKSAGLVLALAVVACSGAAPPDSEVSPMNSPLASPRSQQTPGLASDLEAHFDGPARELAAAVASGDTAKVIRLVREGRVDPNQRSKKGMPLLLWPAMAPANVAGTQALLENGADPNALTGNGENAMVYVAKFAPPEVVRLFARHGGDVNARNAIDEPLLIVAQLADRWDNVQALVESGADVNALDKHMSPHSVAFFYAHGAFDKLYWLLQHGADPGLRQGESVAADRTGAQPILEQIFHRPIDATAFPHLAGAQKQCREWALAHGYAEPPMPAYLKKLQPSGAG